MLRLAVRTVRFRRAGFVASFLALGLGALIVMICGGLLETGVRNTLPPHRLAAAPIVVTGGGTATDRPRVSAALATTIGQLPGVAAAVADVSFPAALFDGSRRLGPLATGQGWSSARLGGIRLLTGTPPANGDVVLDEQLAEQAGVRVGARVEVVAAGRPATYRVTGLAAAGTRAIYLADQPAADVDPSELVDAIGVFPAHGTDVGALSQRLSRALAGDGVQVLTGDRRGLAEYPGASRGRETLIVLAGVFGGIAIMVVVLSVAGTLGLSIQQRHRELALLRAIGTTPRQLRRMVLGEALVVAVLAAGVAWLLGPPLGSWLLGQLAGHGAVPGALRFHEGWLPQLVGAAVAVVVAAVAARVAGHRAGRVRPVEALREASLRQRWVSPIRLVLAVLCLGGGLALALVTALVMHGPLAASTAGPSAMCWAFGLALLAPGLCRAAFAVLQWPLRIGVSGQVAVVDARARRVAMAGVVTPIMLASGLALGMGYLQTTQAHAASQDYLRPLHADAVVTSTAGGLPGGVLDAVRHAPGVDGATGLVTGAGFLEDKAGARAKHDTPMQGITPPDAGQTLAYRPAAGSLTDLHGSTVALPVAAAHDIGRGVGDQVTVWLPDGTPARVRVVALVAFPRGFGTVLLPADLLAAHTASGLLPRILATATPGTDPARLRADLASVVAPYPGVRIEPGDALRRASVAQEQTGAWVNLLIIAVIVGYAAITLVNSLALSTAERRREFALQRLVGATRGQLLRMGAAQSALVTATGLLLGGVVAAATLAPFGMALHGSLTPAGPLWGLGAVVGLTAVLTFGTTLVTTAAVLRGAPARNATE